MERGSSQAQWDAESTQVRSFVSRAVPYAIIGFLVGALAGLFAGGLVMKITVNPMDAPATHGAGIFMLLVAMFTAPVGALIGVRKAMRATRAEKAAQLDRNGAGAVEG